MAVRRFLSVLSVVSLTSLTACEWGGPPPEARAVLTMDTIGTGSTWPSGVPLSSGAFVRVTNTGTADDTAAPTFSATGFPSTVSVTYPLTNEPCDVPLGTGDDCLAQATVAGTVSETVTGTITVTGGPGTVGDSFTFTITAG